QVGAVCHRAVLRPDGAGWLRGHRAADDLQCVPGTTA
ncbi:host specificity protein J, partial [Escherichia coli]|nr:host specificity protein J [Escherichia coli]